jgi:rubrerythrin
MSQHKNIYPAFAKTAKAEGYADVEKAILMTAEVENYHSKILYELFEKVKAKKAYKMATGNLWKCTKCGYEQSGKDAWQTCPLCKINQGYAKIPTEQQP